MKLHNGVPALQARPRNGENFPLPFDRPLPACFGRGAASRQKFFVRFHPLFLYSVRVTSGPVAIRHPFRQDAAAGRIELNPQRVGSGPEKAGSIHHPRWPDFPGHGPPQLERQTGSTMSRKTSVPERFKVKIGGDSGPSYSVRLKGADLWYTAWEDDEIADERKITPSAEQWRSFRRDLDSIGVWDWRESYFNPGVADGTQWSVEIEWEGSRIVSAGDNNYPIAGGLPENDFDITPTFERFLEAVRKLIGGLEFR
jgi:hypothetical protein